jgi:tRNA A-37 threonylcarbamoyl transferase component Bud32
MEGLIGQNLGQYRIVEQIGSGGMAAVFKAYQPGLNRYVAIKVLPPLHAERPGFSERFAREAQAIANLHHPNILPVYDSGQERGYSFIVMRYVEGAHTLGEVMKQPLDLDAAANVIGQVAAALDHAHAQRIIHRDVKPSNVLMDGDWALLTDFGLAKMTESSATLTGTGVGVGTPAYMSPEQGQGKGVDHRTDVYSLGVVLFEMLTGRIPHEAETPLAIILKRVTEPLPLPRTLNPRIPEAVERVILKALAREPADRFDSAGEMAEALKQAVSEGAAEEAEESTLLAQPPEMLRREAERRPPATPARPGFPYKWALGGGVLVVVAALCLVGLFLALAIRRGPTATPTSSALAGTPTATLKPLTLDLASTPTATPEPLIETPVLANAPIYSDDFSQQTWTTNHSSEASGKYENGEYHIVVEEADWEDHETAGEAFKDFALEVTGRQVDGPPGGKYGVVFRFAGEGNYYRFGVSSDKLYSVRKRLDDEWQEIVEWSYSPAIKEGRQANRLKVVAIGDRMAFFANGQHLVTVRDESFSTGDIGVFGAAFDEPNVHVAFDDLVVWGSDAPEAAIPPGRGVLYFNDFSKGQEKDEDEVRAWEYLDGERLVKVKKVKYMSWRDTNRDFSDFYAEVLARPVNDVEGEYGIVFRKEDSDNFYRLQIRVDGSYRVSKDEQKKWSTLIDWTPSSAINKGQVGNRLAVAAKGDQFDFYANDTHLAALEDSTFSEGGVGYFGGTFDAPGFQVAFDDFVVWENE